MYSLVVLHTGQHPSRVTMALLFRPSPTEGLAWSSGYTTTSFSAMITAMEGREEGGGREGGEEREEGGGREERKGRREEGGGREERKGRREGGGREERKGRRGKGGGEREEGKGRREKGGGEREEGKGRRGKGGGEREEGREDEDQSSSNTQQKCIAQNGSTSPKWCISNDVCFSPQRHAS